MTSSAVFALGAVASSCRQQPMNPDTVAPAAPTSIRASGSVTAITISWQAVTTNSDGGALNDLGGYRIYRSLIPSGRFQLASRVAATDIEWRDTSVQAGEIWYYKATAIDTAGNESAFSPESNRAILSIRVPSQLLPRAGEALYLNYDGQVPPITDSRSDLTITRFMDTFIVLSRFCTHAGCSNMIFENALWTCRCHGSQFTQQGKVVASPAQGDLTPFRFTVEQNGDLIVSFDPV